MTNPIFIRPPFLQCHGSTIVELPDGSLAVAWFAGTKEANPDTSIWWSRQQGGEWTRPHMVAKCGDIAHWNPVLFAADGHILLYFKTGRFPDSWDTWLVELDEWGFAISKPKMLTSEITPQGKMTSGPVRGKMVVTSSGAIIAPSSIEKFIAHGMFSVNVLWESVIHRSSDNGQTWSSSMVPYNRAKGEFGGIIQPSVWESSPGNLVALFRSTDSILYRSESSDDGITWSKAEKTDIPNPNSAVDVAVLGNVVALVYNPVEGNWIRRSPLSVALSDLNGLKFSEPVDIVAGSGSYSYPAIIAVEDGFAVAYTWNRRTIGFAKIKIDEFGKAVIVDGPKAYDFRDGLDDMSEG
jgi:predicted neuraminidase